MTGVKNLITVAAEPPEDCHTAGRVPNPTMLLGSPRMQASLQHLQSVTDLVMIDAPKLATTEALLLARRADGVILEIEHDRTRPRAAAQWAVDQLTGVGTQVLGAVLTEVPDRRVRGWS